jgi:mannose/fructose/N-acetylgalactosamine-specific phosphotransferase system component IIC
MAGPAQYLHLGFILISLANLMVIALLIVVFVLAVTLRRPAKQRLSPIEAAPESGEAANDGNRSATGKGDRS